MAYAIKAEIRDPRARSFTFQAQKTMYGGRRIAPGDTIYLFASENEGGAGLAARGIVTSVEPSAKRAGIARQTPRVSLTVERTALAKRPLGRNQLKPLTDWNDGRPGTELNFKFYRQATNKIAGISDEAAPFSRASSSELRGGPMFEIVEDDLSGAATRNLLARPNIMAQKLPRVLMD